MVTSDHLPAAPSAVLVHLLVDFFSYFLSLFIFFFLLFFCNFFFLLCNFFFFSFFSFFFFFFLHMLRQTMGGLCHFAAKNLVNMKN